MPGDTGLYARNILARIVRQRSPQAARPSSAAIRRESSAAALAKTASCLISNLGFPPALAPLPPIRLSRADASSVRQAGTARGELWARGAWQPHAAIVRRRPSALRPCIRPARAGGAKRPVGVTQCLFGQVWLQHFARRRGGWGRWPSAGHSMSCWCLDDLRSKEERYLGVDDGAGSHKKVVYLGR